MRYIIFGLLTVLAVITATTIVFTSLRSDRPIQVSVATKRDPIIPPMVARIEKEPPFASDFQAFQAEPEPKAVKPVIIVAPKPAIKTEPPKPEAKPEPRREPVKDICQRHGGWKVIVHHGRGWRCRFP